jgi:predicted RNA-binding protein with TRAM domain
LTFWFVERFKYFHAEIDKIEGEVLDLKEFGRPPVKVGDVREVRIEAVGSEGDGIAKIDGFVVFVPGAKMNDSVKIRITKVLKKYGFAEIVE